MSSFRVKFTSFSLHRLSLPTMARRTPGPVAPLFLCLLLGLLVVVPAGPHALHSPHSPGEEAGRAGEDTARERLRTLAVSRGDGKEVGEEETAQPIMLYLAGIPLYAIIRPTSDALAVGMEGLWRRS